MDAGAKSAGKAGGGGGHAAGGRFGSGRYILRRVLSRTERATVWLAWQVKQEREVALKIFSPAFFHDANARERLRSNVARNLQLEHPHILKTLELVEDATGVGVALEYIEGWPLSALRVDKPGHCFTLEQATPWIRQLCAALIYAHGDKQTVHGALSTSCLLIDSHENLKLAGFDAAWKTSGDLLRDPSRAAKLGFMSPQIALGDKPQVSDDIYGIGAVLYDLLAGSPPFYKGQVLSQVCEMPPEPIAARLASEGRQGFVPPVVQDTVSRCLAKMSTSRPRDVIEVLTLLDRPSLETAQVKSEAPASAPPNAPSPEESSTPPDVAPMSATETAAAPPARSWLPWAVLALLVCILAGETAWILYRRSHGPAGGAGAFDASFKPDTNFTGEAHGIVQQPDQKVLVAGKLSVGGTKGLVRVNANGAVDDSFLATVDGEVDAVLRQSDGKIFIGGEFTKIGEYTRRHIARLQSDGNVDLSFSPSAGVNRDVRALLLQDDGKLVAAGGFDASGGRKHGRIIRFTSTGNRDSGFEPGSGAAGRIWAVAARPDGGLVLGGDFTRFSQQSRERIAVLKNDGVFDETFDAATSANGTVYAVAIQPDGKILLGGDFVQVNKQERNRICRLNPNGALDETFQTGAGANTGVRCICVQPDGRILIGGIFTSFQGVTRNRLARLNADGSLDLKFNPGQGPDEVVRWITLQADGKILIGGAFKTFDTHPCGPIARLLNDLKPVRANSP